MIQNNFFGMSKVNNDIGAIALSLFSSPSFWSAVVASVVIILIGVVISRLKFIKNNFEQFKHSLNTLVMVVAIPALILSVYMSDLKIEDLSNLSVVLIISLVYTAVFYLLSFCFSRYWHKMIPKKFLVKKYQAIFDNKFANSTEISQLEEVVILSKIQAAHRETILIEWFMVFNNSITFFGLPLVNAIFGVEGSKIVTIFQIFPVALIYLTGTIVFSKAKFNKENIAQSLKSSFVNPMMISLGIGIFMWLTQLIPGASDFTGPWWEKNPTSTPTHGWFNFSVTLPPVHRIVSILGGLVSPIVWIIAGMNLSKLKIMEILNNKKVWMILFAKYAIIPSVILGILIVLNSVNSFSSAGSFQIDGTEVAANVAIPTIIVVLCVTPTTPVYISYSVKYNNNEELVSSIVGITSLFSVITMPLWFIISYLTFFSLG